MPVNNVPGNDSESDIAAAPSNETPATSAPAWLGDPDREGGARTENPVLIVPADFTVSDSAGIPVKSTPSPIFKTPAELGDSDRDDTPVKATFLFAVKPPSVEGLSDKDSTPD